MLKRANDHDAVDGTCFKISNSFFEEWKPDLDFSYKFYLKVNQYDNEIMVDRCYRAVQDVRSGDYEELQLIEITDKKEKEFFDDKNGNFKGVIRVLPENEEQKELFIPIELCLTYHKFQLFTFLTRAYAKKIKKIMKDKMKNQPVRIRF